MFHHKHPTDDFIVRNGISLASRCPVCQKDAESFQHLLFDCSFSKSLWSWLKLKLKLNSTPSTVTEWLDSSPSNNSSQVTLIHCAAIINSFCILWHVRNAAKHENRKPSLI